ncbi:nucleoside-diphosphate kinase [Streptomyces sp. CAU 1734]|uniref:nucleoside-diphosphate kinase n=1 Tax=Streptomyces sp. CAU 1734 TaxID=3140360 RepID=UPI00326020EA
MTSSSATVNTEAVWADLQAPALERLTDSTDKHAVYGLDPFVREGWASLCGLLGEAGAYTFATETGLVWLRPDLVASGGLERVLVRIEEDGFVVRAARPVVLDRAGVRGLWWWQLKRATAERLLLLDAVAELGPGLLVLYGHPGGRPAERLTRLKGGNDPQGRAGDSLRSVAGSENRILTMVHTSDDGADVVRELAVFLPWQERVALVAAACRGASGVGRGSGVLGPPVAAVRSACPASAEMTGSPVRSGGGRERDFTRLMRDLRAPDPARRWGAVRGWARQVPQLNDGTAR